MSSLPVSPKSGIIRQSEQPSQESPHSIHHVSDHEPGNAQSTVILIKNLHCGSCVRYIEELMASFGEEVLSTSVNVVNHEAHVLHLPSIKTIDICRVLEDGAFEVVGATTADKSGNTTYELTEQRSADSQAKPHGARLRLPRITGPVKDNRAVHVEHCIVCQKEVNEEASPAGLASLNTSSSTPAKVTNVQALDRSTTKDARKNIQPGRPKRNETHSNSSATVVENYNSESTNMAEKKIFNITLSIGGMTCSSCTNTIKEGLQKLDGVKDVNVDLMTNSANIRYIGEKDYEFTIVEVIEDLGYDASGAVVTPLSVHDNKTDSAEQLQEATLSIGGMTCTSCSNGITDGLKELSFVKSVDISLMTNRGRVVFEKAGDLIAIVQQVEDLGYDCSVEESRTLASNCEQLDNKKSRTIQLKINGMFCSHCPKRITEALKTEYGDLISIDRLPALKDPIISVKYQPNLPTISIRSIITSIELLNTTFKVIPYRAPSIEDRSQQVQLKERKKILLRLVLSAIIAVPTLLIGVVWMDLIDKDNPICMYFMETIWGLGATRAQWALFFLATPVYFRASDIFHIRALKEIHSIWRRGSKVPILKRFYRFGSMNLLISAGTTVAYVASVALLGINARSAKTNQASTYFDSVVFLTFFILIGKFLEAISKSKAGNAVSMLGQLRPQKAILVIPSGREPQQPEVDETYRVPIKSKEIDTDLLEIGDTVIVPHGSSPPADGLLLGDQGQFDESSLTGESRPVKKATGERVFVGTINTGNPVKIEVVELGGTSLLDQIITVVREGQTKRAPVERIVDVITSYFVPIITALAIITFFVWFALGQSGLLNPDYLGDSAGGWAFWSLEFAIAVFVVACPCGIGLAAPTALFVGQGLAAKRGILVRGGGEAFQEAGNLDAVVFDKTGTLTEGGDLKVTDHHIFEETPADITWSIIRTLEESSSHPIARAILKCASSKPQRDIISSDITEVPGLGLQGTFVFHSKESSSTEPTELVYSAFLGSEALINIYTTALKTNIFATSTLAQWKSEAKSIAVLAIHQVPQDGRSHNSSVSSLNDDSEKLDAASSAVPTLEKWSVSAIFATSDPIRPSAASTIAALRARNIGVYMLSGDNPETARAVAFQLGIPYSNVFAGVLPAQKAEKVTQLQQDLAKPVRTMFPRSLNADDCSKPAKVAFVGDGINDAPALLAATVSISLASGSPIALTSSSFILMSGSLDTILNLIDLSARVFRRIRMNFAWALVYNVVLIPVAAGIFFRVRPEGWILGPVWAAAAMAGSSVSVVLSSLALRLELGFWKKSNKN
jgi:P-type Cu+ transporter